MKILRLLLWEECDRSCPGCCNKDWDLDSLPVCQSFKGYDEILLTGGEPMLYPDELCQVILDIRAENPTARIYIYTARVKSTLETEIVISLADGITVTLHEQSDVHAFIALSKEVKRQNWATKSLRVNIFEGVEVPEEYLEGWKVKKDMKWIDNCPLPENETFMRMT